MAWSTLGLRRRTNSAHAFVLSCALIALSEGCAASFPQQHSAQIPRIVRKDASAYKLAVLTASVTDSRDNEFKTYKINDSVTSWFGTWQFFPSDEAAERNLFYALWENRVKNLYRQISNDSLFASNR